MDTKRRVTVRITIAFDSVYDYDPDELTPEQLEELQQDAVNRVNRGIEYPFTRFVARRDSVRVELVPVDER